jgi:dolichol-phosphate mannosyltransferase
MQSYSILEFTPKKYDIILIIPVWNEGNRIIEQLKKINQLSNNFDLVIVDGCSTDNSLSNLSLLETVGVNALLTMKEKLGLSTQLQAGFDYALAKDYDFVITMDGNNKDEPLGIQTIVNALSEGADFVQGSRFVEGGKAINTPLSRFLAIKLLHAPLTSLFAGKRYTDTTNGFRGFNSRILKDESLSIFRDAFRGYELIAYLPIRIARLGYLVEEAPVTRAYPKNENIPTKIVGFGPKFRLILVLIRAGLGSYNP